MRYDPPYLHRVKRDLFFLSKGKVCWDAKKDKVADPTWSSGISTRAHVVEALWMRSAMAKATNTACVHPFRLKKLAKNPIARSGRPKNVLARAEARSQVLADGSVLYRFSESTDPKPIGTEMKQQEQQKTREPVEDGHMHDLLIVGPGVLGSMVAELWLQRFPKARVVGQTNTERSHGRLRAMGLEPRTKFQGDGTAFPYVIFCAPPSGSDDYPKEVAEAVQHWNHKGGLVFTSSAGVYQENNLGTCDEDSQLQLLGNSERSDKLLLAEEIVHEVGGNVVRLAGLYTADRGAHMFFLKAGSVSRCGENVINLIHYEDAAALTVEALLAGTRSKNYLGCDNHPVTLAAMMKYVVDSGKYEGGCEFLGDGPPQGKKLNNDKTRHELSWEPKHASFEIFVNKI